MTIRDWLRDAKQQIDTLDAELILLKGVEGLAPARADRSWLVAHDEQEIPEGLAEILAKMVERRIKGEPLAYILGRKEFYGREFRVNPAVLIPRPETEQLVEMALEALERASGMRARCQQGLEENGPREAERAQLGQKGLKVLEIGTGSGCIAITVSLEAAQKGLMTEVVATDASPEALAVATENARRLGVKVKNGVLEDGGEKDSEDRGLPEAGERAETQIRLLESDLTAEVPNLGDFDLILANLPYVSRDWEWVKTANLRYEPELALYAGANGLALYQSLFEQLHLLEPREGSRGHLARQVIIEADPCQHAELEKIGQKNGYRLAEIRGYALRFAEIRE